MQILSQFSLKQDAAIYQWPHFIPFICSKNIVQWFEEMRNITYYPYTNCCQINCASLYADWWWWQEDWWPILVLEQVNWIRANYLFTSLNCQAEPFPAKMFFLAMVPGLVMLLRSCYHTLVLFHSFIVLMTCVGCGPSQVRESERINVLRCI